MPHELASVRSPQLRSFDGSGTVMKCLWIARYIPYPLDAGAKVYSAQLAASLAQAGVAVRFLGFGNLDGVPPVGTRPDRAELGEAELGRAGLEWVAVPNARRSEALALFSRLPNGAAIDATPAYRALLNEQLREPWDAIVFDGYGAGWALTRCLEHVALAHQRRAVLVHISHNHEERLWQSMAWRAKTSIPRRLALWQNYLKVRALERRMVRSVDLLTTITDEDRETLASYSTGGQATAVQAITLTPGYAGSTVIQRVVDCNTPRRVIIVGSFRWVMKQENLSRFIELADPVFAQHGIQLDVVGDVPEALLARLQSRCRATHFHGFVDDLAPLLSQARLAIVPELIGGGFKLKFLDYIFAGVPVATLSEATAGLPDSLRQQTLARDDLPTLVAAIVASIDRTDELNRLQQRAAAISAALFRWEDRGVQLLQAIAQLRHVGPAKPRSSSDYGAGAAARAFHIEATPMNTAERTGAGVAESISERIARERDFHNQRFADDSGREARTRRFYDAISYGFARYRRRVSEEGRGRRVLEYGCGTESLAFDLAHIARQVVGIDISDVAIAQARRVVEQRGLVNVQFVVDNAEAMQLPNGSIDVVAGSGIVHHLDIPKSMRELRRVLRDGGIALFAEPLGHNPVVNWYRNRTPELRTPDEHPLLARDLRFMGREFKSMKVTYFGMIAPLLGLLPARIGPDKLLTRFVWWLDRGLCRVPLLNRYAWFCLVELRT